MDPTESQLRRRFLLEIEQAIRLSNREVIHERIPAISSDNILPFAVAVAKTRALPRGCFQVRQCGSF